MLKKITLLCLWIVICFGELPAQNYLPQPALWWKMAYSNSGVASLKEQNEVIKEWGNNAHTILNFHAVPIINSSEDDVLFQPITTQGGITTFSIYQDAIPDKEQSLWSLSHENALVATATDTRFFSSLDSVDYVFAGITNQWLRISTHFLNHQSLSNASCTYYFGQQPHQHETDFRGMLLEEVVFDRILPKKQRKQVESYLSVKYGVPLLSNVKLEYINSTGDVYWSAAKNSIFRHRPTALGRDDFWQLYQKQSTNAYEADLITIGLGNIAPLNEENTTELEDQSFLIWSDNNQGLEVKNKLGLLSRVWEIRKTNPVLPYTLLKLGVRQLKTALEANEKYWLAIDRSGSNSFAVQTTDYYAPILKDSHEYFYYEQIQWDMDGSGKDHFTFLKGGELIVVYEEDLPSCTQGQLGRITFKTYGGTAPYSYQVDELSISEASWSGELNTINDVPPGRYVLRVTDANGLQSEQEIEMNYAELFSLSSLAKTYTINQGDALDLALSNACPDCTFEWIFPDGELISGRQITTAKSGEYQLVISKGDCVGTFDFSVKEHRSPFQSVELWGNPSQNGSYVLEIRLWETQPTSISIFSQQGQLVEQIALPLNHYHKYNGQGLAKGTYHIQVQSNGQTITKKLITL